MMPRRSLHVAVFRAAATYNIAWGVWTMADPQWLFRVLAVPPANHPPVVATLGMLIGLYGVLFLEVARRPERGRAVATVGLAGKTLGAAGMALLVASGDWPASAFLYVVLPNDLVWWGPFALYLRDVRAA